MRALFHKLLHIESRSISASALTIGAGTLINGVLSIGRNILLAAHFGASSQLDAYFAAFRIPDLIFLLIITGGLSAVFIPTFSRELAESKEKAWEFAAKIINGYLLLSLVLAVVLLAMMPLLMHMLVPGFNKEKLDITIRLARLLLLQPILLGISSLASGALQTLNKFFITTIAPILYNLGIICGILFLSPFLGIQGVVFGVLLGALAHSTLQLIAFLGSGYNHKFRLLTLQELMGVIALALPRVLNIILIQINLVITLNFISHLANGSVAIFNFAYDMYNYPLNIFAISLITASFPALAKLYAQSKHKFAQLFFSTFKKLIGLGVLFFIMFAYGGEIIVRYFLQHGSLKPESAAAISAVLMYLNIGIVASALLPYLVRVSFILESTTTPLLTSLLNTGLYIILGPIFLQKYGLSGIAFALSTALWCDVGLLAVLMSYKIKTIARTFA
ncbi:MAG: oligosaccharide flippase family protein [Patescibacteria group bacterium]|nr:oligosaccharide flippase family protein [Patescibacteria group bacterium]MDE2437844.1 oligosaccharide flippase family protein [Patescibacteria group bacterium]